MKAAFHYIVKAKVIKWTKGNEPAFEEINKVFENENPIIARDEAFDHYESWVHILLEFKKKNDISDKEARKELISFIDTNVSLKLDDGDNQIEFSKDTLGNGIGVFFVPDEPLKEGNYDYDYMKVGDELLIHGVGNFFEKYLRDPYLIDRTIISLHVEANYYDCFNYTTRNKEVHVPYFMWMCWLDGMEDGGLQTHKILNTPFNWEGFDKIYWWGEPNPELERKDDKLKEEIIEPAPKPFEEIIEQGESNKVEFKPCLVYNHKTGKGGISVKEIIAKTICSFLNTNGGFLFIGVKDNKTIQGLEFDFSLSNGKDAKDYFQLEFDQMLQYFLGFAIKSNVNGQFYKIKEKLIYAVTIAPSLRKPVFLKTQEGKAFYIRGEASSRMIGDIEDIINYWLERDRLNK